MESQFSYDLDSDVVARYIISLDDQRKEPDVTHLKLQKILYFVQANYLASTGRRLFDAKIEAFDHGPVVYPVYRKYKDYGREIIAAENHPDFDASEVPADALAFIDQVWALHKDKSASQLRAETHRQKPWKDFYREGGFRNKIPDESMMDHYRSCIPRVERVFHPDVVTVDPEILELLESDEDKIVEEAAEALGL